MGHYAFDAEGSTGAFRSEFTLMYEENKKLQVYLHSAAFRDSALFKDLEDIMTKIEESILATTASSG
jgi:hypothetical protein